MTTPLTTTRFACAVVLCGNAFAAIAQSPDSADEPRFKFTTGLYQLSGADLPASRALDVNLRYNTAAIGDVWLGTYRSPSLALTQTRAGWDNTYRLGPARITPSLQTASGGF